MVRGRLWRKFNPELPQAERRRHVDALMHARRMLRGNVPPVVRSMASLLVDEAKTALGKRGNVWWTDDAPDYNRKMATCTFFAGRYRAVTVDVDQPTKLSANAAASSSL
ncbi:hypothetical protein [Rhizobacter sp. Root404]|uniref:hypothetical protein n=1 Tax=Rhizobacter sp. Root404 TaxID=1736528 RepID=UPI00190FF911|nr:hypothetical protein [Rhizobacter sp. Root404]